MFSSSVLKIERADQHIGQLHALFDECVERDPHQFVVKHNSRTGDYWLEGIFEIVIPRHFGTIAGDAIHNLRTALDHLACRLIRCNNAKPNSHSGFPFYEERHNFDTNFKGKIEGASEEAINLIKGLEPYRGGKGEGLWALNKLDIIDKHKALIVTVRLITIPEIIAKDPDGNIICVFREIKYQGTTRFEGRIEVAHGELEPGSIIEVKNTSQPGIDIIFTDSKVFEGQSVIVTLEKLSKQTLSVVQMFATRFGGGNPKNQHT